MKRFVQILALITLVSCSEEEVMTISDHLYGSWEMTNYYRNGINETALINVADFKETFFPDGSFTRFYTIPGGDINEDGSFIIDQEQKILTISNISSIDDFSDANSTLSTAVVNITKITTSEMVYSFTNGGDLHEFHFMKTQ